jgi:hypothetical protein
VKNVNKLKFLSILFLSVTLIFINKSVYVIAKSNDGIPKTSKMIVNEKTHSDNIFVIPKYNIDPKILILGNLNIDTKMLISGNLNIDPDMLISGKPNIKYQTQLPVNLNINTYFPNIQGENNKTP